MLFGYKNDDFSNKGFELIEFTTKKNNLINQQNQVGLYCLNT